MQKEAGECLTIKVMSVFGTRPEAIKMAPLVKELEADPRFQSIVVVTAQHREMLDQVLEVFAIEPDYDLDIMTLGQTLTGITTKVLLELEPILHQEKPSIVLVMVTQQRHMPQQPQLFTLRFRSVMLKLVCGRGINDHPIRKKPTGNSSMC